MAEHNDSFVVLKESDHYSDPEDLKKLEADTRADEARKAVPRDKFDSQSAAKECSSCKFVFQLLSKKVSCVRCGKVFCRSCCFSRSSHGFTVVTDHLTQLIPGQNPGDCLCVPCVDAEELAVDNAINAYEQMLAKQRQAVEFQKQIRDLEVEELNDRNGGKRAEALSFKRILSQMKKEADVMATRDAEAQKKEEKNDILDKWAAIKGPRCGALTVTVIRATNVKPSLLNILHCSPLVTVRHRRDEHESECKVRDPCPEFDFEAHFVVENDKEPVVITLLDDRGLGIKLFLGNTAIDLRADDENLIRNVDEDGIYTERGGVIQRVYDEKHNAIGNCTVEVHWLLTLREEQKEAFCEECGRLEARCECSDEERKAASERKKAEALAEAAAIAIERDKRVQKEEEERKAQEAKEEERRKRREERRLAAEAEAQRRADRRAALLAKRADRKRRREAGEAVSSDDEVDNNSSLATGPLATNDSLVTEPDKEQQRIDKEGYPEAVAKDGKGGKREKDKESGCCLLQ